MLLALSQALDPNALRTGEAGASATDDASGMTVSHSPSSRHHFPFCCVDSVCARETCFTRGAYVIAVIAVVQGSPTVSVLEADVLRLTVANDRLVALREGRDRQLLVAQERIRTLETQLTAALRELEDLRRAATAAAV
jgi:hypothetical protein